MRPTLEPILTVIDGSVDLDVVNQRLVQSGVYYTRVGAVNTGQGSFENPSITYTTPQSCNIEETAMETASSVGGYDVLEDSEPISTNSDPFFSLKGPRPKPLDLISPDSNIRCESPDCPIKYIPHNLGRYFDDGVRPPRDVTDDMNHFFNFTAPPPDICGAYMRMFYQKASQVDIDKVRQYQKHHMWSPITSGPSTPKLCAPHEGLSADYTHLYATESSIMTSHGVMKSSESPQAPRVPERNPLRIQIQFPHSEEPLGALGTPGINDSDDEETNSNDGLLNVNDKNTATSPRCLMAGGYADGNDDEALTFPEARRSVPEGAELRRVQLRLQADIVGQIGQLVHGPGSPLTDWSGLVAEWRNGTD